MRDPSSWKTVFSSSIVRCIVLTDYRTNSFSLSLSLETNRLRLCECKVAYRSKAPCRRRQYRKVSRHFSVAVLFFLTYFSFILNGSVVGVVVGAPYFSVGVCARLRESESWFATLFIDRLENQLEKRRGDNLKKCRDDWKKKGKASSGTRWCCSSWAHCRLLSHNWAISFSNKHRRRRRRL